MCKQVILYPSKVDYSKRHPKYMFMYLYKEKKFRKLPKFWLEWSKSYEGDLADSLCVLERAFTELNSAPECLMREMKYIMGLLNVPKNVIHEPPDLATAKPRRSILKKRPGSSAASEFPRNTRIGALTDSSGEFCKFGEIVHYDAKDAIEKKMCNVSIRHDPTDPFSLEVQNMLLDKQKLSNRSNFIIGKGKLKLPLSIGAKVGNAKTFWIVDTCCGSGSYAQVYRCNTNKKDSDKDEELCVKVQTKHVYWEYHVLMELKDRIKKMLDSPKRMNLFNFAQYIIQYNNCGVLVTNYYPHGTLLRFINWHLKRNRMIPQWMTTFFVVLLLEIVRILHTCNIIHADLKPDNFLVRSIPGFRDGPAVHVFSPLVLIDFNRSIDLDLFPEGTDFVTPDQNRSLCCVQMRENRSWKFQVDTFGLLSTLHCIVFHKYMRPYSIADQWKINAKFPREYPSIWNNMFHHFLNSQEGAKDAPHYDNWIDGFQQAYLTACDSARFEDRKYIKMEDLVDV
ncbi:hypothetical protein ACOME3_000246 [Neoechinorhynchus agilis]